MEEKRTRRKFTAEQKKEIVLLCLQSPGKVSEICHKYKVNPNLYYRWRKQFVEGGLRSLKANTDDPDKAWEKEVDTLQQTVGRLYLKNEFLKKLLGTGE